MHTTLKHKQNQPTFIHHNQTPHKRRLIPRWQRLTAANGPRTVIVLSDFDVREECDIGVLVTRVERKAGR